VKQFYSTDGVVMVQDKFRPEKLEETSSVLDNKKRLTKVHLNDCKCAHVQEALTCV
jgi:hypothetical protein